jgi:hypothetical protein
VIERSSQSAIRTAITIAISPITATILSAFETCGPTEASSFVAYLVSAAPIPLKSFWTTFEMFELPIVTTQEARARLPATAA